MEKISEILPKIRQPIKPRNTSGYGFENILRKEMEKLETDELPTVMDGAESESKGKSVRADEPNGRGRVSQS